MDGLGHALGIGSTEGGVEGSSPRERPGLFGGQLVAQALLAAYRTVPVQLCHSLHGYFLERGDVSRPIRFEVDMLRNGRRYAVRRVSALQERRCLLTLAASFQTESDSPEHQLRDVSGIPRPEQLPVPPGPAAAVADTERVAWLRKMQPTGIDIRRVDAPPDGHTRPARESMWMRTAWDIGDDRRRHQAALAYATDYFILEPALLPHGLSWKRPDLRTVSLDHALWFHRPFDFRCWHLFEIESPSTGSGRASGALSVYDATGRLVASAVQEGAMQLRPDETMSG